MATIKELPREPTVHPRSGFVGTFLLAGCLKPWHDLGNWTKPGVWVCYKRLNVLNMIPFPAKLLRSFAVANQRDLQANQVASNFHHGREVINPSSGLLAVAYSLRGIRPA